MSGAGVPFELVVLAAAVLLLAEDELFAEGMRRMETCERPAETELPADALSTESPAT